MQDFHNRLIERICLLACHDNLAGGKWDHVLPLNYDPLKTHAHSTLQSDGVHWGEVGS